MKTTSRLLCLALLPLLSLLTGCKDDDSTVLEGTWRATDLVVTDASGVERKAALPETWSEVLTLNPDGTFSFRSTQEGRKQSGAGRWSREKEQLTFTFNGEDQVGYSLGGGQLVVSGDIPAGRFSLAWKKMD